MKNYRKLIATIAADLFLIFAAFWTFGQLTDKISRSNFFSVDNILILIFPVVALFLNTRIFQGTTEISLAEEQAHKRKVLEMVYLIALSLPLFPLVLIPFTLGFSVFLLPVALVSALVVMVITWIILPNDRIALKKSLVILGIAGVLGFFGTQLLFLFEQSAQLHSNKDQVNVWALSDEEFRQYRADQGKVEPEVYQALPAPLLPPEAEQTLSQPRDAFNFTEWANGVESRFSENDMINNVLVLNDVTERFWEKNKKLPVNSAEFTSFIPSLKPRYKNDMENRNGAGWIYGVLYRKKSEQTYELCLESTTRPENLSPLGAWQQEGGYYCLQRSL